MADRDLFLYSAHEWRAAMDGQKASSSRVVCAECGMTAEVGKWPDARCNYRLAPMSWQPEHIRDAVAFDRITRPHG